LAAVADTTIDYDVTFTGKKLGSQKVVARDTARVHVSHTYRDNGRGPNSEEDIAVLPDRTFKRYARSVGNVSAPPDTGLGPVDQLVGSQLAMSLH
jgi:hypothetical protein